MRTWSGGVAVACLGAALAAHGGELKLDKEPVVLGRTESVRMELTVDEAPGTADRPLQLKANVGTFGEVSRLGPGRYQAIYVPPSTRFPQVALVAAWRETGPDAPIDFFRVALHGVTRLPVKARPGSGVRVSAGSETTEPAVTNARGEVVVPLVVPPGVATAELVAKEPGGLVTQKKLPVDVPAYNRVTAALVPRALKADGVAWARLEVFYDKGGADVPPSRIKVVPSVGSVTFLSADKGRYVFRYVPAPNLAAAEVRFQVAVQGEPASSASAVLSLTPPTVSRLVVRAPAEKLAPDGVSEATVLVLALDASGLGVTGQAVQLAANGVPLPVVERAAGVYEARYRAPSRAPADGLVQLVATLPGTAFTATDRFELAAPPRPAALVARATPDPAPLDGSSPVELLLEVKDAAGAPLAGAALTLSAPRGVVTQPSEEGGGRYRATWVPPSDASASESLVVRDSSGAFEQPITVRLRERPRFELGARGGFAHSLGDQLGPRAGVEVWRPLPLGRVTLGVGVTVGWGWASQAVLDGAGAVASTSTAHFWPVALRLGWEAVWTPRFSLVVGAGGVAALARMSTSLTGTEATGFGGGPQGFVAAGLRLGPGRAVLEVGYSWVPVQSPSFQLQAGGLAVELGYRFLL